MAEEFTGTIVSNREKASNLYELQIELNKKLPAVNPGQFCMISLDDSSHLLRRPFGIYQISGEKQFSVIFKITGEGTKILSHLEKGRKLSVLLPLGNGYNIKLWKDYVPYIVAGGIGLGSVGLLLNQKENMHFFYGVKSKKELMPLKLGKHITAHYASDDGSKGYKGFVSDLVVKQMKIDIKNSRLPVIFACGPHMMLVSLYQSVRQLTEDVPLFFSLEERMACGIGVCMGCAVEIKGEYKRVCSDGPVFNADDIVSVRLSS